MSYCTDFFHKFKKEGNFCGLDKSQVSRLNAYMEIVEVLIKQKIPEEQIYQNFPVQAARPLISAKGEAHTEGLNLVTAALKKGEKIKTGDLESWINPTSQTEPKPKKYSKPYNGTPQKDDYPVPDAPIAQTLKEKYGGTFTKSEQPTESEPITDTNIKVSPDSDIPSEDLHFPPQLSPDAPMDEVRKRDKELLKIHGVETGFTTAADYDPTTGGKLIKRPPYIITKSPLKTVNEWSPKQSEFIQMACKERDETPEQFIEFLVNNAMEGS